MKTNSKITQYPDKLIFIGILLFLLGLLIGLTIPIMTNPRMGLAAHLEGVMNGMFLVSLGLIWAKILLNEKQLTFIFWMSIYGSFANFIAVIISAITGGGKMMPIAGGKEGTVIVEVIISFFLISVALAMISVCVLVLMGLYKKIKVSTVDDTI